MMPSVQPYRRILVPLDGSRLSESALSHALPLASALAAELHLLRVYSPAREIYGGLGFSPLAPVNVQAQLRPDAAKQRKLEAETYLAALSKRVTKEGVECKATVRPGLPLDTILAEIDILDVDLVVLASHARSGFARFLFGSLAEKLVGEADCAVLVVTAPNEATRFVLRSFIEQLERQLRDHHGLIADQLEVSEKVLVQAMPIALERLLEAFAERSGDGPDLEQLIEQLRFYGDVIENVGAFLRRGHHGPDLGLVAQVFDEPAAQVAAEMSESFDGLSQKQVLHLLALLAPILLSALARHSQRDSDELRQFAQRELERC